MHQMQEVQEEVQEGTKYQEQGSAAPPQTKAEAVAWWAHPAMMDRLGVVAVIPAWESGTP